MSATAQRAQRRKRTTLSFYSYGFAFIRDSREVFGWRCSKFFVTLDARRSWQSGKLVAEPLESVLEGVLGGIENRALLHRERNDERWWLGIAFIRDSRETDCVAMPSRNLCTHEQ